MANVRNAALAFIVPWPSILFYIAFLKLCHSSSTSEIWRWCWAHPIALVNALFFFNVDLLFWVISLLQNSTWLIDLYWTVLPVMMAHYYSTHPYSQTNLWRSTIVIILTWVWSIRLTHNYFRREEWQWGVREDWRFADMRRKYANNWWWMSFFAVYVSQQIFLVGVCLPIYAIHNSQHPWNALDYFATLVCTTGIIFAYFADTQLYNFVQKNKILRELGATTKPNLEEGLWALSRHPNYFGEQLWWWGLVIYAWNIGQGWTFMGAAANTCCLAYVTVLVERKMVAEKYREEEYSKYQGTTSVWIPWFKLKQKFDKDQKKH
ncbi:hypothetical protein KI387_016413 [Taxus chinensis]|uniref:Steroid 5-alpha reductase C-terminal domain-containing protein n=1 Tax=Taxus chinensis TaxID=29808 RepID=A0AA38GEK3_TAXCH|nr:hypothetical protein KI387_016413 [Taxus chinensis]